MTITAGAIERAVIREGRHQPHVDTLDRLDEIEQQIQIAISGSAGATVTDVDVDVTFDVEFSDGTFQRYSNLTVPHMTGVGAYIESEGFVVIGGCVRAWATDDRGMIVGATIAVGAHSPGAGSPVTFTGKAHITIQGFGSVPNEPADPDFTP